MQPASKLSGALWRWGRKSKESLQPCLQNRNIYIKIVDAKCRLTEMTKVMMSLPLARAFTCFSMFFYICIHFHFALIGGNLTAQSMGSHRGTETQLQALLPFPAQLLRSSESVHRPFRVGVFNNGSMFQSIVQKDVTKQEFTKLGQMNQYSCRQ